MSEYEQYNLLLYCEYVMEGSEKKTMTEIKEHG